MGRADAVFRRIKGSPAAVRYASAVGAALIGVGLTVGLQPFVSRLSTAPLFAVVLVTAWLGGFAVSIPVTLLGAVALAYLGEPTIGSATDVSWILPFVLSALAVSWLAARLSRLQAERNELLQRTQQAMAQAQSASQAKDDFLAMVSHELRTPLTAVLGWIHLLRASQDAAQLEQAIAVIERNTRLQALLIEELLDTSRMTSGRLRIRRESTDFAFVVRHVIELLAPVAVSRGVTLNVLVDGPLPLVGDEARLEQAVTNIVSNAIKFTPRGGRVDIRGRQFGGLARLIVRDSGIGIDPMLLPHIFDPFRQGTSGLQRHEGLGLGLAIAKHLVTLHGGIVQAQSDGPDSGATFIVELPLVDGKPTAEELPQRITR